MEAVLVLCEEVGWAVPSASDVASALALPSLPLAWALVWQ